MSKLISGDAKVNDLYVVREAALQLGWDVLVNVPVNYYEGAGEMCDLVVSPHATERNKYGEVVGKTVGGKYTIGFQQDKGTGAVTMLHDNAMDGAATYTVESGQQDQTTQRVVGKLKQAIAQVQVSRLLAQQKASWRVQQRADGAQVFVIARR